MKPVCKSRHFACKIYQVWNYTRLSYKMGSGRVRNPFSVLMAWDNLKEKNDWPTFNNLIIHRWSKSQKELLSLYQRCMFVTKSYWHRAQTSCCSFHSFLLISDFFHCNIITTKTFIRGWRKTFLGTKVYLSKYVVHFV